MNHLFNDKWISQGKAKVIAHVNDLHSALEEMHKGLSNNDDLLGTKAQAIHSAITNVQPINFLIGDNIMMRSANFQLRKWNIKWIGLVHIMETKSDFIFVERIRLEWERTQFMLTSSYLTLLSTAWGL